MQDGFGIQTKQGQLLLPLYVHLFRSIHSDSQPDLSGLLYPLLVILSSVANFTLAFFFSSNINHCTQTVPHPRPCFRAEVAVSLILDAE